MRDLTKPEMEVLEGLIDRCGLQAVCEALSEICGEKAEHIRHCWQDPALARVWDTACGRLGVASTHMQGV
jgi:hypothetical protein